MNYTKKKKITILITIVFAVLFMGVAIGILVKSFGFGKPSYYTVDLDFEKISDISAKDMKALILKEMDNANSDIYLNMNPYAIQLNTDCTIDNFTAEVLISEYNKTGELIYRPYQIRISHDKKIMKIIPEDYTESANTKNRYCTFEEFWDALACLPTETLKKIFAEANESREADFYSLEYTPYDNHLDSSLGTHYIFYNKDGVITDYRPSPSVIFQFWWMVMDENKKGTYIGADYANLYYYADR